MIDPIHIRAAADRAMAQIRDGVTAVRSGDVLMYELHFSLAQETLRRLTMLLSDARETAPMRKLVLVRAAPAVSEEPEWFGCRANDEGDQ